MYMHIWLTAFDTADVCTWNAVYRCEHAFLTFRSCRMHVDDEKHLFFDCPAVQPVRDRYPALFGHGRHTMQLFMWQADLVGVAHFIMDCFNALGAQSDAHDDASDSPSSALAAG